MKHSTKLAVFLLFYSVQICVMEPAKATLIAHYEFEGNANDSGSNAYHGSIIGSASSIAGVNGNALLLSSDYIDIPRTGFLAFNPSDTFSFALWVRVPEITTNTFDNFGIVNNHKSHVSGHQWGIFMNDGFNGKTPGGIHTAPAGNSMRPEIDDNEWHHLAYVRNQNDQTLQLYLDGLLLFSVVDSTSTGSFKANPISVGNHLGRLFTMGVDDLRFYDHALNQDQVSILAVPAPPVVWLLGVGFVGLMGWYRRNLRMYYSM